MVWAILDPDPKEKHSVRNLVTNCPLAWSVAQYLPLIKRTGRVVTGSYTTGDEIYHFPDIVSRINSGSSLLEWLGSYTFEYRL